MLSSNAAIKEAHNNPAIEDRPENIITLIYKGSMIGRGIINNSGTNWKESRRFTLKTLRDFGLGKATMEDIVLDEYHQLKDNFNSVGSGNTKVFLHQIFNRVALNIIWRVIAGERYQYEDPKLEKLIDIIDIFTQLYRTLQVSPLVIFPLLRYVPLLN